MRFLHPFVAALAALLLAISVRADEWTTLRNCQLNTEAYGDGDSFHIRSGSNEHIVRLYFVDCPETNGAFPGRIAQQAAHWGLTPPETIQLGQKATTFSRKALARPFTVVTRFEDARGNSGEPRYFGFVIPEASTKDLAELLTVNGLARVYGASARRPGGRDVPEQWQQLHRLENEAKAHCVGGWSASVREQKPPCINLNVATQEELESLPGIGKVLAARIIQSRPYSQVQDLERVKGIKKSTLSTIADLVCVKE
ncbi:MAG TPA: helix-hairpin-helix domain-containing protein [Chthoniobacterales bacterium]